MKSTEQQQRNTQKNNDMNSCTATFYIICTMHGRLNLEWLVPQSKEYPTLNHAEVLKQRDAKSVKCAYCRTVMSKKQLASLREEYRVVSELGEKYQFAKASANNILNGIAFGTIVIPQSLYRTMMNIYNRCTKEYDIHCTQHMPLHDVNDNQVAKNLDFYCKMLFRKLFIPEPKEFHTELVFCSVQCSEFLHKQMFAVEKRGKRLVATTQERHFTDVCFKFEAKRKQTFF